MSDKSITESVVWKREARAYAQAFIDQAGGHAPELTAYAERWVADCYYGDKGHRELLAARLTAYSEAYTRAWDAGQAHGYKNGMEDGAMTAKREMAEE